MLRAQIQRQKRPTYVNVSHVGKRFHRRHRSRGVSVSRNIKRRLNVRRLISLKEEDICFQRFLMLSLPAATYKRASISSGLKGGGSRSKQKNWDYTRLAKLSNKYNLRTQYNLKKRPLVCYCASILW